MCVYIYIYIHTHTYTHTHTQELHQIHNIHITSNTNIYIYNIKYIPYIHNIIYIYIYIYMWGFPVGSDGEESACDVGDPGSISGLGRSPGEGSGYPL